MIKKLLALLFVCALFFGACTKETRTLKEIEELSIQEFLAKNNLLSQFKKDSSGFYYQTLREGKGDTLKNFNSVFFLLDVKTIDGSQITSTGSFITSSETYSYMPNLNSVEGGFLGYLNPIGLRNVLLKAKYGEKLRAILPSYLMFGKDGYNTIIKGNTILDITIDIVDAKSQVAAEDSLITRYLKTSSETYTRDDETGIYYNVVNEGAGADIVIGSSLKTLYTGKLLNGAVFDSSKAGEPLEISLYTGSVIDGWVLGLQKIKKGGKIKMLIPSYHAYKSSGNGRAILPNTPLFFEVEVLDN